GSRPREERRSGGSIPRACWARPRERAARRGSCRPRGLRRGCQQEPRRETARLGAGPGGGGQGAARQAGHGRREEVVTRQLSALVMIAALVTSPGTAQAATVLPLTPPPPDIAQLVPFAEAPIEKPSIAVADLPLPPSP